MIHSRAPRIGYLVQQFLPEVGAGPARISEMAAHWIAAGAEVTVITGMPNRPQGRIQAEYRGKLFMEEEWDGIRVLRSWLYASPKHGFARTIVNNLTFMGTSFLHALARRREFDVLIASSPPFFPHCSGVVLGAAKRVPVVLEVRDLWPDYLVDMGVLKGKMAQRVLFGVERRLLRSADHVIAVTESFKTRIIDKGVPPERISVVPNGVDGDQYYLTPQPRPIDWLRTADHEFVVGYLGNIGAGQHLSTVVEAASLLAPDHPDIRFVIVGDGPDRQRVESYAAKLGLSNLAFHPPIPKEETRDFYASCDLCLVPLAPVEVFQDTIPSKIFEIMACERPLVASVAGEAADIVERSGGGVTSPPGNAQSLAAKVLELRRMDARERASMGRAGREYVLRHFERRVLAERYLETLLRVADRDRLPSSTRRERLLDEPPTEAQSATAGGVPKGMPKWRS